MTIYGCIMMGSNFYHFATFSVHFNITDLVKHGIFI